MSGKVSFKKNQSTLDATYNYITLNLLAWAFNQKLDLRLGTANLYQFA